jgi:hypothetical protein
MCVCVCLCTRVYFLQQLLYVYATYLFFIGHISCFDRVLCYGAKVLVAYVCVCACVCVCVCMHTFVCVCVCIIYVYIPWWHT